MTRVVGSILELIGETPLVRLSKVPEAGCGRVLGKLESLNPGGSIKDRVALAMVEHAEKEGRLQQGSILVEATGGNTGVSLALVASVKGYRIILVMPDNVPPDRQRLLMRFGVEVRLTPSYLGMEGSHRAVREIESSNPRAVALNLFSNPMVVEVHANATAHEIVLGTGGKLDAFVAGVGTGGTLMGVGRTLKRRDKGVLVVAVEPSSSPMISKGQAGPHGIPGIGADFVPPSLDRSIIDEVILVSDEDAQKMSLRLAREEGLMVGISSGATVVAAIQVSGRLGPESVVVTILADTGERYLSYPT